MRDEKAILRTIISILKKHLAPEKIWLFGSRAKGEHDKHSDFDIAIQQSNAYSHRMMRKALEEIDLAVGIYSVDVVDIREVDDNLRELILNQGRCIYERKFKERRDSDLVQ